MRAVYSMEMAAAVNAAQEEAYLRRPPGEEGNILFLYVNAPAVLIGRHQNPWAECDVAFCREHGIAIVRRISGGGAVYHDEGNVNVSLAVPKDAFDLEKFASALARVVASFGVPDVHIDRHFSVFSGNLKLCGVASAVTGRRALLHGCILVSTELRMLTRALRVPAGRVVTGTAVASARASVACLGQFDAAAVVPAVLGRVEEVFGEQYGGFSARRGCADLAAGLPYAARYSDDAWTYGHCGRFTLEERGKHGWLSVTVASGIVESWRVDGVETRENIGQPLCRLL